VCEQELVMPKRGRRPKYCCTRCRVAAHREEKRIQDFVDHLDDASVPLVPFDFLVQVPAGLRELPRWVRHQDKRPMAVGGWWCSVTDSQHWSTLSDAVRSTHGDGVGFVLNGDGIVCLDLDDCVVDGRASDAAEKFISAFPGAYVEISPSGRGLHVWGRGYMDKGRRFTRDGLKVEAYPDGRYITVTGNVYRAGGLPVMDLYPVLGA